MPQQKSASRQTHDEPLRDAPPLREAIIENPFETSGADSSEESLRAAGIVTEIRAIWTNRALNFISIVAPLAGTIFAFSSLDVFFPSIATAAVFLAFFFLNALGLSLGMHRYFTHRAFRPKPWLAAALAIAASWAFQGPIGRWVADHRRHHRFSDSQFDPHSPYWTDKAPTGGRLSGWLHAHILWMLTGKPSCERRYASDVHSSKLENWCSANYWLLAASGLAAPAAVGFLIGGDREAVLCFLWAGCFRVSLLHQLTWSINSFGHMFGTKVEGSKDESRDNRILAVLLVGEGLHSYHHRYPLSAVNQPAQLDASGAVLKFLAKVDAVGLPDASRTWATDIS